MPELNPADYSNQMDYMLAQQMEQERQRRAQQQAQAQQQQVAQVGSVVGAGAGLKAGQSAGEALFSGLEAPNTASSVMQSAAPTAAPTAAPVSSPTAPLGYGTAQYSPVPTATESSLGFGAGAPQGPAIGSSANGGFINGSVPGPEASVANTFGQGLSSVGNVFASNPWLGPLAVAGIGAYTGSRALEGYKAGEGKGGLGGLKAGIKAGGVLNAVPVLGQAPAIAGLVGGLFGSKKGGDQRARDVDRSTLANLGLMTQDGRRDYITQDGRRVDLNQLPVGFAPNNKNYNIDWNAVDPSVGEDVGALNALVGGYLGQDSKRTSDAVGQLINAGRLSGSTSDVVKNTKARIDQVALEAGKSPHSLLYEQAATDWREGRINADERDSRFAAVDKLYGVKNESGGRWDQQAQMSDKERERNSRELNEKKKKKK